MLWQAARLSFVERAADGGCCRPVRATRKLRASLQELFQSRCTIHKVCYTPSLRKGPVPQRLVVGLFGWATAIVRNLGRYAVHHTAQDGLPPALAISCILRLVREREEPPQQLQSSHIAAMAPPLCHIAACNLASQSILSEGVISDPFSSPCCPPSIMCSTICCPAASPTLAVVPPRCITLTSRFRVARR